MYIYIFPVYTCTKELLKVENIIPEEEFQLPDKTCVFAGFSDLASVWGHEGTRTNLAGLSYVYITEKPACKLVQSTTFGLFVEASLFRLTNWFHMHLLLFI